MDVIADKIAELRALPGIDLTRQEELTEIIVETTVGVYELILDTPALCTAVISGGHFKLPTLVQLIESTYDRKGLIGVPGWIGKGLRMQLRAHNGIHQIAPATGATIMGEGWSFDVF